MTDTDESGMETEPGTETKTKTEPGPGGEPVASARARAEDRLSADEAAELCSGLLSEAEAMEDQLVAWRRDFHQFPELGLEEYLTAGKIAHILSGIRGVELYRGFGMPTSIIARCGAWLPGKAVAFRAEMDAVEVQERTGLPFSSYEPSISQAQGHDAHMASLLGAIILTAKRAAGMRRPAVFIFQPGEEGKGGAKRLLDAGVLSEFGIGRIYCLHWMPHLQYGRVLTASGPVSAFSSKMHIGLSGQGGHGSMPHLAPDPLFLAGQIMISLQTMISREFSPQDAAVISFGRAEAGDSYNIIPEEAHLWGTVRAEKREVMDRLRLRAEETVKCLARNAGLSATVEFMLNYHPILNDPHAASDAAERGAAVFGPETSGELERQLLLGNDFSCFSERVPSCMMFLGTGMEQSLYHTKYDVPESLLPFAAAWSACVALTA